MAAGIATGFVRKLYRILDHESDAIISWDPAGLSFSIHDSDQLNDAILPRYFRGRLCAFRQQLVDHGFQQLECEENETRETYQHVNFVRGCPAQLSLIVRAPKGKKAAANGSAAANNAFTPPAPTKATTRAASDPANRPSLTVHLNGSSLRSNQSTTAKRSSPHALPHQFNTFDQKRARVTPPPTTTTTGSMSGEHHHLHHLAAAAPAAPVTRPKNPLFSNDPDTSILSMARLSEMGSLPCSTDLPEPISYLMKMEQAAPARSNSLPQAKSSSSYPTTSASSEAVPTPFSDDLVRSALYFLVSTSVTGTETVPAHATGNKASATMPTSNGRRTVVKNGTNGPPSTDLLSTLLASSATNAVPALSDWAASVSSSSNNPLFSDQSIGDDDEEQDSIWNLLVASSIDRVKGAITDVVSPHEKLRLILEERERLEDQRRKIGAPQPKLAIPKSMPAARPTPAIVPNSATSQRSATTNPLFAKDDAPAMRSTGPNDEELWRLLMTSSVDSFRRAAEYEV